MVESSLHNPPVFPRFAAGGCHGLALPRPVAAVMVAVGLPLLVAAITATRSLPSVACVGTMAAVEVLTALLTAGMAARWLGRRLGTLAGGVYLVGAAAWAPFQAGPVGPLLGLATAVAAGAFAASNVAGRLPLVERRWPKWTFAAAAGAAVLLVGPIGVVPAAVACAGFALLSADQRAARFFADRTGFVIFCVPTAIRLLQPAGWRSGPLWPAGMAGPTETVQQPSPWTSTAGLTIVVLLVVLPALAAVIVGIRQGHYATPFWRLTGCWLLGSAVLSAAPQAASGFDEGGRAGMMLAPLALLAAAGWSGGITWYRRRGYRHSSTRRATRS